MPFALRSSLCPQLRKGTRRHFLSCLWSIQILPWWLSLGSAPTHGCVLTISSSSSLQSLSKILDAASLEALNECNRRSLKKLASQADSTEQVDDTILT